MRALLLDEPWGDGRAGAEALLDLRDQLAELDQPASTRDVPAALLVVVVDVDHIHGAEALLGVVLEDDEEFCCTAECEAVFGRRLAEDLLDLLDVVRLVDVLLGAIPSHDVPFYRSSRGS